MVKNPYHTPTLEEKAQKEASKRQIEAQIKAVGRLGKDCLDDLKFKKYKAEYLAVRELVISLMKQNSEPDPVKYAFFCKACLSKLDGMDMLIDLVQKDAKRR